MACTMLRTLTAPSSSISLRMVKRSSGENYMVGLGEGGQFLYNME